MMDVMKKMDFHLQRDYPEYANIPEVCMQFYESNWKHIFDEMINRELILADAEAKKVTISDGEIHEEMELLFGPNVIATVENLGLSYHEAWDIIKAEAIINRMITYMVHPKAMARVTPIHIKKTFKEHVKDHVTPEQWSYRILSFNDDESERSKATADTAYSLLADNNADVEMIIDTLHQRSLLADSTKAKLSAEYHHSSHEISPAYKEILDTMEPNTFSPPIEQISRSQQLPIYRIFSLTEYTPAIAPNFEDVEAKIKNTLLQAYLDEETTIYILDLRQRFGLDDDTLAIAIPDGYKPFALL